MAREMRGVNALEGPELGALMAQAMQQRVRNKTTTAQRARLLRDLSSRGRGNIVEAPGARLAAGEAAIADDARQREYIQNIHSMRRKEDMDLALAQREASMANALGRGLRGDPNDPMNLQGGDQMWTDAPSLASQVSAAPSFQGELGGTNAEEEALLAQMQADMVNQPGAQGFTSEGYMPGGPSALPQATAVPQTPQVAGPTETAAPLVDPNAPQGFTSEGYVPGGPGALPQATPPPQTPQVAGTTGTPQAQQPGPQGFTSPGYTQGPQAEAGPVDSAGSAALQWLNELFKKDEQPQGGPQQLEQPQVPGDQGFTSPGYVSGGGQKPGETFMEFTQRQHQEKYPQQGQDMTPEEQQKIKQIEQGFQAGNDPDAAVSWPPIGDQGAQTPGGFQSGGYDASVAQLPGESFMDYTKRMHQMRYPSGGGNADEVIGSLLKQFGSQLEAAGYGEQMKKFASGNYTKADIDALIGQYGSVLPKKILEQLQQAADSMASEEGAAAGTDAANVVVEELPGLDPNYAGQQGTTSSGSSSYAMARDIEGSPLGFHAKDYNPAVAIKPGETFMEYTQRMHRESQERNWVDPDQSRVKATGLDSYR